MPKAHTLRSMLQIASDKNVQDSQEQSSVYAMPRTNPVMGLGRTDVPCGTETCLWVSPLEAIIQLRSGCQV